MLLLLLLLDDKIKIEIDKKTRGGGKRERRKEGKEEREDLPPCPFNALAMFPGTSPKYEDIFYFFFVSLFSLYNDDTLCFQTVILKKKKLGFSQV